MTAPLLTVEDLHTYYGESHILQGLSFAVRPGTVLAILGRNGAGKTTTLKSIMRIVKPRRGRVSFAGRPLDTLATFEIARAGIAFVQETRAIFPSLSVAENLAIAARAAAHAARSDGWTPERIFASFPRLYERRDNGGAQLSGGEQQMLAIARALVANPRLLLLDEPSEGLAPLIVREIGALLTRLKGEGLSMVLVEQNFSLATSLADDILILGKGCLRWQGSNAELRDAAELRRTWLGI